MKIAPPGFRGGLVDKVELMPTGVFAVVIGVFGSRFADPVESKKSTHSPKYSVSRCDIVIRTALIGLQIVISIESPSRRIAAAPGTCLSAKTQPDSPSTRIAPITSPSGRPLVGATIVLTVLAQHGALALVRKVDDAPVRLSRLSSTIQAGYRGWGSCCSSLARAPISSRHARVRSTSRSSPERSER